MDVLNTIHKYLPIETIVHDIFGYLHPLQLQVILEFPPYCAYKEIATHHYQNELEPHNVEEFLQSIRIQRQSTSEPSTIPGTLFPTVSVIMDSYVERKEYSKRKINKLRERIQNHCKQSLFEINVEKMYRKDIIECCLGLKAREAILMATHYGLKNKVKSILENWESDGKPSHNLNWGRPIVHAFPYPSILRLLLDHPKIAIEKESIGGPHIDTIIEHGFMESFQILCEDKRIRINLTCEQVVKCAEMEMLESSSNSPRKGILALYSEYDSDHFTSQMVIQLNQLVSSDTDQEIISIIFKYMNFETSSILSLLMILVFTDSEYLMTCFEEKLKTVSCEKTHGIFSAVKNGDISKDELVSLISGDMLLDPERLFISLERYIESKIRS